MARVCEYCQKKPFSGFKVSHSNIKTKTRWIPNLKRLKAVVEGTTKTVRVCTRCIRTGVAKRPVKRNYKPTEAAAS